MRYLLCKARTTGRRRKSSLAVPDRNSMERSRRRRPWSENACLDLDVAEHVTLERRQLREQGPVRGTCPVGRGEAVGQLAHLQQGVHELIVRRSRALRLRFDARIAGRRAEALPEERVRLVIEVLVDARAEG